MMKKASVVTAQDEAAKIATLARVLPEPADFYAGHKHTAHKLPDNILLFHRTRAADLNNTTKAKAFHQRHVLIVPIRGSGRVIANARAITLSPGRCVLIAPFQFHHYTALSHPRIDWLFITFTYGNHPLAHVATNVFSTGPLFWSDLAELVRDFQDGSGIKSADRLAWRLALLLNCLAANAVPQTKPGTPGAKEKLLLRVSGLASTHLHEPLSVSQLAKKLGLSSSHLRQRFQQTAGISVGRFLREFRLRHAAELLATGQTNVTEAATACGWDTPYAFSRAFRNYWGRPPKTFALAGRR